MSTYTMPCEAFQLPLHCLLFLSVIGLSHACPEDPASAYRFTGAVCRLTYPAAVVCKCKYFSTLCVRVNVPCHICVWIAVNQKTTKVIEAAFQHAQYPSLKGEKSLAFVGKIIYGLDKLVAVHMHTYKSRSNDCSKHSAPQWCHPLAMSSLEIRNLSIGRSEFELCPNEGIRMEITNVSAFFQGTIQYGYGSWLWV